MKREIKFRAWSEKNKEMYFPDENYCFRIYNDSIGFYPHHSSDDLYFFNTNPCDGELKIEVMQYTGFPDINGKEIYEGDIMDYGNDRVFYVSYVGCQFVAAFNKRVINSMIPIYNYKVIGNIYENPELLGTKKDELSERKAE